MILEAVKLILEAARRPGLQSASGVRREKIVTRDLKKYFAALKSKIELDETIEHPDARAAAAMHSIERAVRTLQPVLIQILALNLTQAYLEGDKITRLQESDTSTPKSGVSTDPVGASAQAAASWATDHAATLVKGIDATTLDLLQSAIAKGITEQLGVGGLGRFIRTNIADMSVWRSELIASTEMNHAFSEAAIQKMQRLGYEYKRVVADPDACDICLDNEDDGAIPVDEDFASGDARPPFHPYCRCAVVAARAPDTED